MINKMCVFKQLSRIICVHMTWELDGIFCLVFFFCFDEVVYFLNSHRVTIYQFWNRCKLVELTMQIYKTRTHEFFLFFCCFGYSFSVLFPFPSIFFNIFVWRSSEYIGHVDHAQLCSLLEVWIHYYDWQ